MKTTSRPSAIPRRTFLRSSGALAVLTGLELNCSAVSLAAPATNADVSEMLARDLAVRVRAANERDRAAWNQVRSLDDWKKFVRPRIDALRASLGNFPPVPNKIPVHVGRAIQGEGFRIENLVYESRAGIFVTANLYLPARPAAKVPAIVIIHSHHNPKTQSELQDMGMTWARAGCAVLVPDQLGYGERRDHTPGSRQDYRFRYFNAQQLHTIGDSLMGWMVWDTSRGLDAMMQRAAIDSEKVILLGAVAGGGDPAAVTAALDPRFTCVAPFNFGGPQPESRFPLPDDAETSFNYLGGGSWESTRNLLHSGSDGFFPWLIVASIAPRRLIYGHEFSWDRERDPVWRRLEKIYAWHGVPENLAFTHGHGRLSGRPPEGSHCNNIGPAHRKLIHAALEKWFGIRAEEYSKPLPAADLVCFTPELRERLKPRPAHEIYAKLGAERIAEARDRLSSLAQAELAASRRLWANLLGNITPHAKPEVQRREPGKFADALIERFVLVVEPGIDVPVQVLMPTTRKAARVPVVIGVSQFSRTQFLVERADTITALLAAGVGVCLPDVRGTGETRPTGSRDRQTEATSLSATELMLGGTLLGARLRDLFSLLWYLRSRGDVDAARFGLWGDSFAPVNPPDFADPLIGEGRAPNQCEPVGGVLALLGALFERDVRAIVARGMLPGFHSLLGSRFCYVPHDVVVPGVLTVGDLADIAAVLPHAVRADPPCSVRIESLVDGRNVALGVEAAKALFRRGLPDQRLGDPSGFIFERSSDRALGEWFARSLA
jgi:dienelactone hydrolase